MRNQTEENIDHQFENGYCVNCGWSKRWAKINGWKCPVSDNSSKKESFKNEAVDFLKHRFVNGYCEKCGWSYDWAKIKSKECPVFDKEENSWKSSNRKNTYQNESKEYESTDKFNKSSDAIKYGNILELKGKVTVKDIKNNYRKLSKKYHPDRVENLGSEFSEIADKKMKEINEAYNWFKKKYKF